MPYLFISTSLVALITFSRFEISMLISKTPTVFRNQRLSEALCLLFLLSQSCFSYASNTVEEMDKLAIVIIAVLVLAVIISQISRTKHKRGRLYLQLTQKELEQRIVERTEKLTEQINKQKTTEVLLTRTQEYLNSIINSMPSVLIGLTKDGTVTHWNQAAIELTGISAVDALNRKLFEITNAIPVTPSLIVKAIQSEIPVTEENLQQPVGESIKHYDLAIYPLIASGTSGAVIRLDDVTLRVRMENMMIQNEKMLSLGELAAGMAHEINNPLSAITNSVQNICRRTSDGLDKNLEIAGSLDISLDQVNQYLRQRDIFKFLDTIREASDRSAKIVTNMLEFSRNAGRDHEPVDLVQLMDRALLLANNAFELKTEDGGITLQVTKEYEEKMPLVNCSPIEIEQVMLNLLRNACQCFQEANSQLIEPKITLRIYRWDDHVGIEIEDNGPGMNEEVSRHIFEPFYTTKAIGKGTGLGLSVSYFIITEHHKGRFEVESTAGKGTNFIITLPI